MFAEHNFNIGLPDNLVNVNEYLDMLEAKLTGYELYRRINDLSDDCSPRQMFNKLTSLFHL